MAYVKMRNKQTGEFRDVEQDGPEHKALKQEVGPSGFPLWEQTGYHHADDVAERATYAELLENDLGEDYKEALKHEALILDAEGIGPEQNPHLALSPGEIEAGLTPQTKLDQLRTQYASSVPTREQILQKAHEQIAEGDVKPRRSQTKAKGLRARAGGSDDRDNAPIVDASQQDEGDEDGATEQEQQGQQLQSEQARQAAEATRQGASGGAGEE